MVVLFTSILFLVTILPLSINTFFAENIYVSGRKQEMILIYQSLVSSESLSAKDIYSKLNTYEDELNLRALVFSEKGVILYQTLSGGLTEDLLSLYNIDEYGNITTTFEDEPQVDIVSSYRNNLATIAVRGSISTNYGNFYIILESPLSAIQEATYTLNKIIVLLTLAALYIGSLIIYYFAFRITKPILEINDVAKNLANMDFSKKVSTVNSKDEIATLAKNINFMSDQLERMFYDLKVANMELQKDNDLHKQIDNMRRDFIANVSHELKTPLSLMQGYSEMLKEDIQGIDKDFYYDVIIDESKHMNELVRRLLDISSLENGMTKLNYEKFNLSELAFWIVSKTDIIAKENDITITHNLAPEAFVFADKLLIEQAITNFLSNAITYAKVNINIEVLPKDDKFMFKITNDGSVISDEDLEKIWHSFYRTDKSRTRSKDKNFGLGLYIVKTIMNAHNGDFGAFSEDDRVTFWFELNQD